jgi:xanthine dehydrogenase large subunit
MGQGLFIKVAQVVAETFQVDIDHIKISATRTDKVPNTSATAASAGADMNGMAAQNAALKIKQRLIEFAANKYGLDPGDVVFRNNRVALGDRSKSFAELVMEAYLDRVSLSATGYYRTPKIYYDREQARGRPFLYFAYGAAVSEVEVDSLTGEYRIARVDILHDTGKSLNPAVDMGQIEGGFVQGAGWLTSEELCWDSDGKLQTHAPSTYKIPVASDVPEQFDVRIWKDGKNREKTIHRSKAVGEPPLMLAISVYSALNHAISSFAGGALAPLDAPATPERVLSAIRELSGHG